MHGIAYGIAQDDRVAQCDRSPIATLGGSYGIALGTTQAYTEGAYGCGIACPILLKLSHAKFQSLNACCRLIGPRTIEGDAPEQCALVAS